MTTANNHVHPVMAAILNGHAAACTPKLPVAPAAPPSVPAIPEYSPKLAALLAEAEEALGNKRVWVDRIAEAVASWAFEECAAAIGGGK